MAAIAFVVPLTVGSHSGEVGRDGCHAGGEPYHCHFRMSKSSRIRLDPPGTPLQKIRKAGGKPELHRGTPAGRSPNVPDRERRSASAHRGTPAGRSPNVLEGAAKVIDGDTIEIAGNRIRLHGIDALEGRQHCRKAGGTSWACGEAAARALRMMTAGGRTSCRVHGRDEHGRVVATCYDADGVDLNGWMVRQGLALAYRRYSRRYVGDENAAREARMGIHSGEYERPWEWRRRNN